MAETPPPARGHLYRLLPCPVCGRRYSPDPAERFAARCCGADLPGVPVNLHPAKTGDVAGLGAR